MPRRSSSLFRLLGLGFAVAGADKLLGDRGYERLYQRRWGWSAEEMRRTGLAELLGGALVAMGPTRRLGGVVLAVSSVAVLRAELRHNDAGLAIPRLALLLASVAAMRHR